MRRPLRSRSVQFAGVAAGVAACLTLADAPASADTVQMQGGATIIHVGTGTKYSNHTQYVSYITVQSGHGCGHYEAWTQGFYASTDTFSPTTWYVSRSVSSGNGVCGAVTIPGYNREVACISISV